MTRRAPAASLFDVGDADGTAVGIAVGILVGVALGVAVELTRRLDLT